MQPPREYLDATPLFGWLAANERSVNWLARRSGYSEVYIRHIKSGRRRATIIFARRVAAALDLPLIDLFAPLPHSESGETDSETSGGAR